MRAISPLITGAGVSCPAATGTFRMIIGLAVLRDVPLAGPR